MLRHDDKLQGRNNERLNTAKPTNCECTAAWQNSETHYKVDQVSKPSPECVIDAKDWVDNGSKL
jgi:hypothetical protein